MLKNMTIRARVIAAFALVLCATFALGLFAIQRLSAVNASAKDVGTNWLPAANYLGDLSQDFETYRSRQGQALLLTGEAREKMLARMQGSRDALEKDYVNYNATVATPDERVLRTPFIPSSPPITRPASPWKPPPPPMTWQVPPPSI